MDHKSFEFRIGGREVSVAAGKLVCVLFRRQQEVDYFAAHITDEDESATLRVFNNVELVRRMAGLALHSDGLGATTAEGQTFYDDYGWWPPVIIKDTPNDDELEWFMDANAGQIDKEWDGMEA